ncbi:MAG: hypothetical protein MK161_13470, partial [Pirellulales bacterium]|nr:hypothetical protein [Pirellulales bacterium]
RVVGFDNPLGDIWKTIFESEIGSHVCQVGRRFSGSSELPERNKWALTLRAQTVQEGPAQAGLVQPHVMQKRVAN